MERRVQGLLREVLRSPLLWNANITPMLFSGKMQMVASLQSNNVGNDLLNNNMISYYQDADEEAPDEQFLKLRAGSGV